MKNIEKFKSPHQNTTFETFNGTREVYLKLFIIYDTSQHYVNGLSSYIYHKLYNEEPW